MCTEDLRLLVRYVFLSVYTFMRFVPSNLKTSVTTYNCSCIKMCMREWVNSCMHVCTVYVCVCVYMCICTCVCMYVWCIIQPYTHILKVITCSISSTQCLSIRGWIPQLYWWQNLLQHCPHHAWSNHRTALHLGQWHTEELPGVLLLVCYIIVLHMPSLCFFDENTQTSLAS